MNKKILLGLATVAVVIAGVALTSAWEAHIINVTAHIENALDVETKALEFGTVFPQEYLEKDFTISLSKSFAEQNEAISVNYVIKQKPKCECDTWADERTPEEECLEGQYAPVDYATHLCPAGYTAMEDLCPYLSKLPEPGNDFGVPSYYVPGDIGQTGASCNFPYIGPDASGILVLKDDETDTWTVDLKVPPFAEYVAQDWPADCPVLEGTEISADGTDLGCDLWIEVNGINRTPMETVNLENKDEQWNIIVDDTYGIMNYTTNYQTFSGNVVAYNIEKNAKYQITLNGPGVCSATDNLLALAGSNLFQSGYWTGVGPNLSGTCTGAGEGVYNMDLITDWYTVETDANGYFNYSFNLDLPSGNYTGVKVLVKKMLDTFISPWVDDSTKHTTNLFETAPINFTVL